MPNIGPLELIVVLLIVLVILGPKKLPGVGRSLGSGIREFKDSVTGDKKDEPEQIEARREPIAPVTPPTQATPEPSPLQKAPAEQPAPQRDPAE